MRSLHAWCHCVGSQDISFDFVEVTKLRCLNLPFTLFPSCMCKDERKHAAESVFGADAEKFAVVCEALACKGTVNSSFANLSVFHEERCVQLEWDGHAGTLQGCEAFC